MPSKVEKGWTKFKKNTFGAWRYLEDICEHIRTMPTMLQPIVLFTAGNEKIVHRGASESENKTKHLIFSQS